MKTWLAGIGLALCATLARAAPPPLEAYGKLPTTEMITISPDGKRLAMLLTNGDQRFVAISDVTTKRVLLKAPAGATKVTSVQWAGSAHVIVTVERDEFVLGLRGGKHAWFTATDLDVERGQFHPLIDAEKASNSQRGESMNVIYGRPQIREVDGKLLVFVEGIHFDGTGKGELSLFRYDPSAGVSTLFRIGDRGTSSWLVGEDGQPLAQTLYDDGSRRWTLRNRVNASLVPAIVQHVDIEGPSIVGLGRDGHSTLLSIPRQTSDGARHVELVEIQPDQTAWGPPVLQTEPDCALFDPVTHVLIGSGELVDNEWRYTFFDPEDQKRWGALRKTYTNSIVRLQSMSGDHLRWVVEVDSPTEGPAFALVDYATGKAQWLGYNYEAPSRSLAEKRTIAFKASDGLPLTGFVTLPSGRSLKGLPLIVLPHTNAADRDGPGFDWWAQALASRGYAVLQVNFRGSAGLGWSRMSAGFGEWGRKMQTDLSDGVRYLASEGMIDSKKVCIVGSGYGGYAALAGATLDPGVYRCAVSVAGVSDLKRLARWDEQEHGGVMERYDLRFMGVDKLDNPRLDEISPLRHVDKVDVPILLIHGKDDTVVDFSQSQLMYDALKRAGKDVQLVTLAHEDHWLLTGATRLQMLQATMDFLIKNNPPG